jgi:hypothetical protein
MLELGISQAQSQFTKLLTQTVLVVDKKAHVKKAVIIPYEEYEQLLHKSIPKDEVREGVYNQFVGILDNNSSTDDEKYNRIIA